MLPGAKGVKQYPNRRRPDQIALTLLLAWLSLTLLAVGLCENSDFQTEGGREGLGLGGVVAAGSADNFFSVTMLQLMLHDYLTI